MENSSSISDPEMEMAFGPNRSERHRQCGEVSGDRNFPSENGLPEMVSLTEWKSVVGGGLSILLLLKLRVDELRHHEQP